MQTNKYLFILFGSFLVGCADGASSGPERRAMPLPADRPSADAVILSRDIPYQNDERISYCEVLSNNNQSYSGFRDQSLYPLASLSKVITSAWALKKLGPDFRFETTWHLRSLSQPGAYDVYLNAGYDPVFNIEKILYSLALLKQQGVSKIRNLIIDESTRVFLSVLSQPHVELVQVPISSKETIKNLNLILNSRNWSTQTQNARQNLSRWARAQGKSISIPSDFSVESVEYRNSSEVDKSYYTKSVSIKSSKLIKYLKNLNIYSNNYISDAIFNYLGGVVRFEKFQIAELKLGYEHLQLFTGSGLADEVQGPRKDNLGTCFAMIKVLNYMDQLTSSHGLNLGHIMYNPAQDLDGTFKAPMKFSDQVVVKTGRLFQNPAFNLAGIISTTKGYLYFVFLGHSFSESEAGEIERARNKVLVHTLNFYETKSSFQTLDDTQIFL